MNLLALRGKRGAEDEDDGDVEKIIFKNLWKNHKLLERFPSVDRHGKGAHLSQT